MDEGGFVIDYLTPAGTALEETDRQVHRIEEMVAATPEVAGFSRRTGSELGLFATEQNSGDILVRLKPPAARKRTAEEVIAEQRAAFAAEMPGMTIEFVQLLQDMLGDLEGNPEPIEVKIFGDDPAVLGALAARTAETPAQGPRRRRRRRAAARQSRGDVAHRPRRGRRGSGSPSSRWRASSRPAWLGRGRHRPSAAATALIDVRVRFPDAKRFELDWIREYAARTPAAGEIVPLATTATIEPSPRARRSCCRENLRQMVPVTARLEGRDLGSGVRDVETALRADPLPVGYTYEIGGQYESAAGRRSASCCWCSRSPSLLVFAMLVVQFRRFTPALLILLAAPLSLVGALRAAAADRDADLNVSSAMGLILLVGLVVKNGIMLLDFADARARPGARRPARRCSRAGRVRLRPILMTTLCTLFGLLPLALGLGAGAELQKPLALAVIGGLSCRRRSRCCSCRRSWRCCAAATRLRPERRLRQVACRSPTPGEGSRRAPSRVPNTGGSRAPLLEDEERDRARPGGAEGRGEGRSAHEEGRREGVGHRGFRGQDARAAHALGRPAGARVEHVSEAPAVRLEVLLARGARGERGVAQAQEAQVLAARAQRPSSQLSPPHPRWLLPPAVRRARATPRTRREAATRSSAQPFPTAPKPISTPGTANRTARPRSSSTTLSMPERAGAAAISSSAGRRGRRSRKPHAAREGRAGRVEGTPGGGVQLAAEREQGEEAGAHRHGGRGGLPVQARHFARLPEHGERGLDHVHLVEGRAGGVHVPRVAGVEGDLEAAGHGGTVDLQPVAGLRGLAEQPAEEGAAADPARLLAHPAPSTLAMRGGRAGVPLPDSSAASHPPTDSRSGPRSTPA